MSVPTTTLLPFQLRVLEACRGQRTHGPLVLRPLSGKPIDRRDAYRMVARIARRVPDGRPDRESRRDPPAHQPALPTARRDHHRPRRRRPAPRDAQILARHADPRTTEEHYDRARSNLDRHGVHFLTANVAGV